MSTQNIYIVITQTGTVLSRLLKIITRKQYNHASIALDKELNEMYSFGRLNPYNPFWGGFVHESIHYGTFKRFHNTEAIVLEVKINNSAYQELMKQIYFINDHKTDYGYNYLGLLLCGIGKSYSKKNRYYCSEFVRDLLLLTNADGAEFIPKNVHPMDFSFLPSKNIYKGKLKYYPFQDNHSIA